MRSGLAIDRTSRIPLWLNEKRPAAGWVLWVAAIRSWTVCGAAGGGTSPGSSRPLPTASRPTHRGTRRVRGGNRAAVRRDPRGPHPIPQSHTLEPFGNGQSSSRSERSRRGDVVLDIAPDIRGCPSGSRVSRPRIPGSSARSRQIRRTGIAPGSFRGEGGTRNVDGGHVRRIDGAGSRGPVVAAARNVVRFRVRRGTSPSRSRLGRSFGSRLRLSRLASLSTRTHTSSAERLVGAARTESPASPAGRPERQYTFIDKPRGRRRTLDRGAGRRDQTAQVASAVRASRRGCGPLDEPRLVAKCSVPAARAGRGAPPRSSSADREVSRGGEPPRVCVLSKALLKDVGPGPRAPGGGPLPRSNSSRPRLVEADRNRARPLDDEGSGFLTGANRKR